MRRREAGFALFFVLVALVCIAAAATGTLTLAAAQARTSGGRLELLRARVAAATALSDVLSAWPADPDSAALADAAGVPPGSLPGSVVRRSWLADGLVLLRAAAAAGANRRRATAGLAAVVRSIRPAELVAAVSAAATLGPGASLLLDPAGTLAAASGTPCDSGAAGVRIAGGSFSGGTAGVTGAPPFDTTTAQPLDHLGPLALAQIEAAADTVLGAGPFSSTSPAGVALVPAGVAADVLEFSGILVAGGDVLLPPGAVVQGLVLVAGSLTIQPGASVTGALVVAGGSATVGGTVAFDRCVLATATASGGLFRHPFRLPGRFWLPAY